MPTHYEIDCTNRLILSFATGTLTDDEMDAHRKRLAADPDFDPEYRQLADFRGVTRLEITTARLREFAADNPWKKRTRRAFVCGSNEVFGMSRMFQLLTDGASAEVGVFRDLEEARAWLGLDPLT